MYNKADNKRKGSNMALFDFMKKKSNEHKEYLLQWQNTLMTDSQNELVLTEQQLKSFTMQQAENDMRIFNDSIKLVENTTKPDVFFMRLNLLVEKLKHLISLEKYVTLSGASIKFSGESPAAVYNEITQNYHEIINQFLIRYFSETFDKAEAMKTEKGRIGKYQKFYDSLQEYYRYMNDENIDYIETKYRAYTRHQRG